MDLDETARQLFRAVSTHPHTRVTDDTNEDPGIYVIGDFLLRSVLPFSMRGRLSSAETCFILRAHSDGPFYWPLTESNAHLLLTSLSTFIKRIKLADAFKQIWDAGFIFFGTSDTIDLTLRQLDLVDYARDCTVVLTAAHLFFNGTKATRTTRHIVCNVRDTNTWFPLAYTSSDAYSHDLTLCAFPEYNKTLSRVRRAHGELY